MRLALFAPIVMALVASPALAGEADYDVHNSDWNGLSDLATLAEASGLDVTAVNNLDWEEVGPDDVLVILYPLNALEPAHVAAYLRGGGRLLIADDFGKADEVLARLGMLRRGATGVRASRWHDDNMALPVATPQGAGARHPLAKGVDELHTNVPALFAVDEGPTTIFGFGGGEAVVVAGQLGDGRFVALSDPSILINGMLGFDGNATFAANTIDWLATDAAKQGSGRMIVLTQRFWFTGEPRDAIDKDKALGSVNAFLRELNKWLEGLNDYIASEQTMRALGIVGACAVLLFGLALLPLAKDRQRLDGAWTRAAGAGERVDFERILGHYDNANWDGSFAHPAALLREAADGRLAELLATPAPLVNLEPREILIKLDRKAGAAAAMAVRDALPRFLGLPTREQAQGIWGTRHIGRREFERAFDAYVALDRALTPKEPGQT